jgi:hypothetical protein
MCQFETGRNKEKQGGLESENIISVERFLQAQQGLQAPFVVNIQENFQKKYLKMNKCLKKSRVLIQKFKQLLNFTKQNKKKIKISTT